MPIADSIRFQLLDLGKQIVFARDRLAPFFHRLAGIGPARVFEVPPVGHPVEFASGQRAVTGWFVPHHGPLVAAVLLFHGIGDHTSYWRRVQQRLALAGMTSLIFDLPGYGGNRSPTRPGNMEADARAAYALLAARVSAQTPIVLLGFSLGSGLAAQVAPTLHPPPAALILAEAFTTLREGAMRAAWPAGFLGYLIPDLWNTRKNVAKLGMPLLLIHSSGDKLFPASMAEDLYGAAHRSGTTAKLSIFPGYAHDAPFRSVPDDYWTAVVDFIALTSHSASTPSRTTGASVER